MTEEILGTYQVQKYGIDGSGSVDQLVCRNCFSRVVVQPNEPYGAADIRFPSLQLELPAEFHSRGSCLRGDCPL